VSLNLEFISMGIMEVLPARGNSETVEERLREG
jgi:hypothetical protein